MKILFVEDQITRNISRITRLFEKYLTVTAKNKLERLEREDYPPEPEDIKKIIETSKQVEIEIEHRFPEALQKVINHHERYALFVVDRNLFEEEGYDFKEIKAIDPSFSEEKYEMYAEREGDYLLNHLVYKTDVLSKFYFMTAYSANDAIRGAGDIQTHINLERFSTDNFIEKGNEADFERLKFTIDNIKILHLQFENRDYLQILRKNINEESAKSFLKILDEKDEKTRIGDNLKEIRNVYENILKKCVQKIPDMDSKCINEYGTLIMGKQTIDWLSNNNYINIIIRNFLFSINKICSEFGAHPNSGATPDTVNSLVYALKDVILWFGKR